MATTTTTEPTTTATTHTPESGAASAGSTASSRSPELRGLDYRQQREVLAPGDGDPAEATTRAPSPLTAEQRTAAIADLQNRESHVAYHYGFIDAEVAFFAAIGVNGALALSYGDRVDRIATYQQTQGDPPDGKLTNATLAKAGVTYSSSRGLQNNQRARGPQEQSVAITLLQGALSGYQAHYGMDRAAAKRGNDREFDNMAVKWANTENALPINGSNRLGLTRFVDGISKVSDIGAALTAAKATEQAKTPDTPIADFKIKDLAFFTHGSKNSLLLGSQWKNAEAVKGAIGSFLADSVNIYTYACSTTGYAGDQKGLAHGLATGLAEDGHSQVNVYGHDTAGHTTYNSRLTRVSASGDTLQYQVTDSRALLRDPAQGFASTDEVIPRDAMGSITETSAQNVHFVGSDGRDWGWTRRSNLTAQASVDRPADLVHAQVTAALLQTVARANGYNLDAAGGAVDRVNGQLTQAYISSHFLRWQSGHSFAWEITTHPREVVTLILHRFVAGHPTFMTQLVTEFPGTEVPAEATTTPPGSPADPPEVTDETATSETANTTENTTTPVVEATQMSQEATTTPVTTTADATTTTVDTPALPPLAGDALVKAVKYNDKRSYSRSVWRTIQEAVGAGVDGDPGSETAQKVYAWQAAHDLETDGKVGPATKTAIVGNQTVTDEAGTDNATTPNAPVSGSMILSGSDWYARANSNGWRNSTAYSDLDATWGPKAEAFVEGIRGSGGNVSVSAGLRHPLRARLMHYAWKVSKGQVGVADANTACQTKGININWDHGTTATSRAKAAALRDRFGMAACASLTSNHIYGKAIDIKIHSLPKNVTVSGTAYTREQATQADSANVRTNADRASTIGNTVGVKWYGTGDYVHWSHSGR